jgi:ACS family hexuronate transporter-like MFS transporter
VTDTAPSGRRRWLVVGLLFAAMVINYVDRQTLGILKPTIGKELGWTASDFANVLLCFQGAYAVFYIAFGRLVDRIGARWGFSVAFGIWSLAQVLTSQAQGIGHFMIARFALGVGESGAFPSAIKATADWFPQRERAFANGLFNAGTNIGAIVTPLLVPAIALAWGWRAAFVATGLAGLIWLPIWFLLYRRPAEDAALSTAERAWIEQDPRHPVEKISWLKLIRLRETWAYMLGKFTIDPIWGMFLSWLPDFLDRRYHLNLKTFGLPLIMIYLLSDGGSVGGGWLSSHFLQRGWSVNRARKTTMLICALAAMPVMFAASASNLWIAVALIGLAAAAHQGFSATLYTLPTDLLPRGGVGTVIGMGGALGAVGGMAMSKYTGWVLDSQGDYRPVFLVAGCAYLVSLSLIHLLTPRMERAAL